MSRRFIVFGVVVDDVPNRTYVHNLASPSEGDMVLFGFTQCRCELHLCLVSHVLLWEQQNRVLVYRCMQLCYFFTGKRTGQVDAIYARTEVVVKRFELHVN